MYRIQPILRSRTGKAVLRAALIAATSLAVVAFGQINQLPEQLEGVGVDEKLGAKIDLDLEFTGENGYPVSLRKLVSGNKPVVLDLVYYRCPMLCNLVLNAQTKVLKDLAWTAGKEFDVVTISIDPMEGFDLAKAKKKWYLSNYDRPEAATGWHFMADYKGNAKRLADQIGFNYRQDPKTEQYAHAAAIMVLTPDGRVSRYLYGVAYQARDMRLALTEASEGRLGSLKDKVLLYCFHYDAQAKSYVPFARNLMKAGGVMTVFVVGMILSVMWRKDGVANAK
jgi:protein SCO1